MPGLWNKTTQKRYSSSESQVIAIPHALLTLYEHLMASIPDHDSSAQATNSPISVAHNNNYIKRFYTYLLLPHVPRRP